MESTVETIEGETCPVCMKPALTLMEEEVEIPYFGLTHVFSMKCGSCGYGMADVEAEEDKGPVKQSFKVESDEDLNVRVVKSAAATVKIPRMVTIESGPDSDGYISNVEGLLKRFKQVLEDLREDDDKNVAKKARNHLKKLNKVLAGHDTLTIRLEDPTGNSAIISDKSSE